MELRGEKIMGGVLECSWGGKNNGWSIRMELGGGENNGWSIRMELVSEKMLNRVSG